MSEAETTLDADEVLAYLQQNPDFLGQHDELLVGLLLRHQSDGAASLLNRQNALLRDQADQLRQRLYALLDNAQRNDRLFERCRNVILKVLEADSLTQLIRATERSLQEQFDTIDNASLLLFGSPDQRGEPFTEERSEQQLGGLLRSGKIVCGVLRPHETAVLFADSAQEIASAAVVPLHYQTPQGILAVASRDPRYFTPTMDTLFLSHLGEVIARYAHHLHPAEG